MKKMSMAVQSSMLNGSLIEKMKHHLGESRATIWRIFMVSYEKEAECELSARLQWYRSSNKAFYERLSTYESVGVKRNTKHVMECEG